MALSRYKKWLYLRDVFTLSFLSFGGPFAHISLMMDLFVHKRKYINQEEFVEINALCSALPGPSSTQTVAAIGYQIGGGPLAALSLLVWVLPATLLMTLIALIYVQVERLQWNMSFLQYLPAIATGFIAVAAIRIGKSTLKTPLAWVIAVTVAAVNFSFRTPYLIPASLIIGGFISFKFSRELENTEKVDAVKISWQYLFIWLGIFIFLSLIANISGDRSLLILQNNYQYGSMIFGGGQVLIPIMFEHFVHFKHYMSESDFLTGYGIAQGIPGPVFSFTSFIGGVSLYNETNSNIWLVWGSFVGMLGIFTPGIFFILFAFPIWKQIKRSRGIMKSLLGVNAAALGFIIAAFVLFSKDIVLKGEEQNIWLSIGIVISVVLMQLFLRIASHFIVALGVLVGILMMVLV